MSFRVFVSDQIVVNLTRATSEEVKRALRALASLLCDARDASTRVTVDGLSLLKPAFVVATGKVLGRAPALTSLTLSNLVVGSEEAAGLLAEAFADALLQPELREVRLVSLLCAGPGPLRRLEAWVAESVAPLVERLSLEDLRVSPECVRACVAQGVKRLALCGGGPLGRDFLPRALGGTAGPGAALEALVLQGARLDAAALSALAGLLPRGLRHLELAGCGLDETAAVPLAAMAASAGLQHLGLADNPALAGRGLQRFCVLAAAAPGTCLQTLSLRGLSLARADLAALVALLESVDSIAELNLAHAGLGSPQALAVLLHHLAGDACCVTALDLSGNPLHALPNFSDLFAALGQRSCSVEWLSLADCGLDRGDALAVADFLEADPRLAVLDLSGNALGAAAARLGAALARNGRLRSLALRGCGLDRKQAEALCAAAAGACHGLTLQGLPHGVALPPPPPSTLVTRDLAAVAPAAVGGYSAYVLVDSPTLLADSMLPTLPFMEELWMQRCVRLSGLPLPPPAPLRHLRVLSLHACRVRDLSVLFRDPAVFPVLEELALSSNRIRALGNQVPGLARLHTLCLRCNLLQDLPVQLTRLAALRSFDLSFNPLGGLPSFVASAGVLQGRHLTELFDHLAGLAGKGTVPSVYLRLALFTPHPADTQRFLADIRPILLPPCLTGARRGGRAMHGGGSSGNLTGKRVGLRVSPGGTASATQLSQLAAGTGAPVAIPTASGAGSLGRRRGRDSGVAVAAAVGAAQIAVEALTYGEGQLLDGQRVELRVWHAAGGMRAPHLLACGTQAVYAWVFDSAQYEEDAAAVARDIVTWCKMVEQAAGKQAQLLVAALAPDEAFAGPLAALETSLRAALPNPPPHFGLVPHKSSAGAGPLLRALAAQAHKRLLLGVPVPGEWLSVAASLEAQVREALQLQPMAAFAAYAEGYGVARAQVPNLLRFLHDAGVLWWREVPGLQDWVFGHPPTLVAACLRQLEAWRPAVDLHGVLVTPPERLWLRELNSAWQAPFLRLLVHLEFAFEMSGGKLFVPSALPTALPLPPAQAPAEPSGGTIVAREYHFLYVPNHFFWHFCVKVAWFSEVVVRGVAAAGLAVELDKGGKTERGRVTWDAARFVLNVAVETPGQAAGGFRMHKGQLLRFLVETAEGLARGLFRAKFSVRIPCNHCLQDPATRAAPFHFSYQAVVDALTSNARTLPCRGLKSRQVLISALCPDLALADVARNQIAAEAVELGEVLGKGGFATVFRAAWRGRQVAVKQMHACHSQEEFSEFQREAWIMSGLRSPYLTKLLGVCLEPPMLVMELLHGSLYTLLRGRAGRPLDLALRLQIALDIAMGMSVLESSAPPLIHRDLKSPNILMVIAEAGGARPLPCCKVTDFGLSKQLFGQVAGRDVFNPDWLAPEIILEQPYTMSSDVFSYGIILWELVSLEHPFDEYAPRFVGMPDALKEEAIARQHLRPTVPAACEPWYAELLTACWSAAPEARPTFERIVEVLLDNPSGVRPALAVRPADPLDGGGGGGSGNGGGDGGRESRETLLRSMRHSGLGTGGLNPVPDGGDEAVVPVPVEVPLTPPRPARGHSLSDSGSLETPPGEAAAAEAAAAAAATAPCRVVRRVLLPSAPTAVEATRGDVFWVGLRDGSVACVAGRVGSVLSVLAVRPGVPVSCLARVHGKIWTGCRDGFLASIAPSAVLVDASEPRGLALSGAGERGGSEVRGICATWLPATPAVVAFADGTVALLRADLQGAAASVALRGGSARAMCLLNEGGEDGSPLVFVGDAGGTVWVLALPELAVRGSFACSAGRSAVASLVLAGGVLWAGLESGALALFRVGSGISTLASRAAHQRPVVAVAPFERARGCCSVSREGHLCWWNTEDYDLEWENQSLFGPGGLAAAVAAGEGALAVCEVDKAALTFVSLLPAAPAPAVAAAAASVVPGEVEQLLAEADADTRLYVLLQRFGQSEVQERRVVAKTINTMFFACSPCPVDMPRPIYSSLKAQLAALAADPEAEPPQGLFDALAAAIFNRKRSSSIMDLTKTVFMDLCAKGIELRALTYEEGLVVAFASLCDNYDAAAWEQYEVAAKARTDGRKVRLSCWKLRQASQENGAFTGKSRITINAPEHVLLQLVSRPEHKMRWEKALSHSELLKQFSSDFFVLYSVYETHALMTNRDAVVAYLTTRHEGNLIVVARSVPYGNIPVPPNHLRLVVDISGFHIRRLGDNCCEVTQLLQLRDVRRANVLTWNLARRKRMAVLLRLKEYAESMDAEQLASFPPYREPAAPEAPHFVRAQNSPPSPRSITPATPRLELGSARAGSKKL